MSKKFHQRNIHNNDYDFNKLVESSSSLEKFIEKTKVGKLSIDYSNAKAVLALNKALLQTHYGINNWDIPKGHLCPPIPGRVDYIHYLADVLAEANESKVPVGTKIKGLDIGTGANGIYPLLANSVYGWKMVGSDVETSSLNNVKKNLTHNPTHKKNIKLRYQQNRSNIFKGIIKDGEKFDFTMCNPPFYSSKEEASLKNKQKNKNLNLKNKRNFGGTNSELWCDGGEFVFIKNMIIESVDFKEQCRFFTTLVSNKKNIEPLQKILESNKACDVKTILMSQGNKISHILVWSY